MLSLNLLNQKITKTTNFKINKMSIVALALVDHLGFTFVAFINTDLNLKKMLLLSPKLPPVFKIS